MLLLYIARNTHKSSSHRHRVGSKSLLVRVRVGDDELKKVVFIFVSIEKIIHNRFNRFNRFRGGLTADYADFAD